MKLLRNIHSNGNKLVCSLLVCVFWSSISRQFFLSNNGRRMFVDRDIVELPHVERSYPWPISPVLGPFSRKRIRMSRRGSYLLLYVVGKGKSRSNDKYREYTRLACTGPYQLHCTQPCQCIAYYIHIYFLSLTKRIAFLICKWISMNLPWVQNFYVDREYLISFYHVCV